MNRCIIAVLLSFVIVVFLYAWCVSGPSVVYSDSLFSLHKTGRPYVAMMVEAMSHEERESVGFRSAKRHDSAPADQPISDREVDKYESRHEIQSFLREWPTHRKDAILFLESGDAIACIRLQFDKITGQEYCASIDETGQTVLIPLQGLPVNKIRAVWASPQAPVSYVLPEHGSEIRLNRTWHDLGLLPDGAANTEASFTVSNTGKVPVLIQEVTPGCGCVSLVNFSGSEVLPPGETKELRFRAKTDPSAGISQTISLVVSTESGPSRQIRLHIFGWRFPVASITPETLDFGTVFQDVPSEERVFRISETLWDHLAIKSVESNVGDALAEISLSALPNGRKEYKITVRFISRQGTIRKPVSELWIHTSSKVRPLLTLPFRYTLKQNP